MARSPGAGRAGGLHGAPAGLVGPGVPDDLARRIAAIPDLVAAPDIVLVAEKTGRPVGDVARTHFAVEAMFQLGALIGASREIQVSDYFDLPRSTAPSTASRRRTATSRPTRSAGAWPDPEAVRAWSERRGTDVSRIRSAVDNIVSSGLTLSKVTVASSLLGDLARS